MSKNKDIMEDLRQKLFERKKEEQVSAAEKELSKELTSTVYTILENPEKQRDYKILKIALSLDTNNAKVEEVRRLSEKTVGMTFVNSQRDLKYLFDKSTKEK